MPREQVEWYVKQSLHDNDRLHARQSCTYYSIVNVDKTNYPYSSSFEQEQTWTLMRTMSNNNKRYQSSIENIHLTVPPILTIVRPFSSKTNQTDYENVKIKMNRSGSFLPPLPPARQHALSSHHLNRGNMDSTVHQQKTLTRKNSSSKTNSIGEKSQPANPMRIMQVNGEFIVRI